jgi:hypothetical protein
MFTVLGREKGGGKRKGKRENEKKEKRKKPASCLRSSVSSDLNSSMLIPRRHPVCVCVCVCVCVHIPTVTPHTAPKEQILLQGKFFVFSRQGWVIVYSIPLHTYCDAAYRSESCYSLRLCVRGGVGGGARGGGGRERERGWVHGLSWLGDENGLDKVICVCARARACVSVCIYTHIYVYLYIHTYIHI